MPKLRIEESAARKQARVDRGEDVVVGVNKYVPEDVELVDVLDIDNTKVREGQIAKLPEDPGRAATTPPARPPWTALTEGARGDGNLLALAVEAARARATLGEISDAMEACSAATRPRSVPSPACTARAYEGDEDFAAAPGATSTPSPRPRVAGPACWS